MFHQAREGGWMGGNTPDPLASSQGIYVVVNDPDAHHDRATAASTDRERAD
jgi:hypothetical protein